MVRPGVVMVSKFFTPDSHKSYSRGISYIDRKESKENRPENFDIFTDEVDEYMKSDESVKAQIQNYKGMLDYMDRNEAKKERKFKKDEFITLFTLGRDKLNKKQKEELSKEFDERKEQNGLLWHNVFSFDNSWLIEKGIYSPKKNFIDEKRLKEATRRAMERMDKEEELGGILWCGNIHYNTDNIHIHVSSVQQNVTREKGKLKKKTLDKMKSDFVNELIGNEYQEYLDKIDQIIRNDIISGFKDNIGESVNHKNSEMKEIYSEIYIELPKDRKNLWNYSSNLIKNTIPKVDKFTNLFIEEYHKEDFKELNKLLDELDSKMCRNYGEKGNYKGNKLKDLNKRLGNIVLKDMKRYDKELKKQEIRNNSSNNISGYRTNLNNNNIKNYSNANRKLKRGIREADYSFRRLNRYLSHEFKNFKNQIEYEKLQREIERVNNNYDFDM